MESRKTKTVLKETVFNEEVFCEACQRSERVQLTRGSFRRSHKPGDHIFMMTPRELQKKSKKRKSVWNMLLKKESLTRTFTIKSALGGNDISIEMLINPDQLW